MENTWSREGKSLKKELNHAIYQVDNTLKGPMFATYGQSTAY